MADLRLQAIGGTTFGANAKRIFPSSELGTPKITPVILIADGTLPSGNDLWADGDNDVQNYNLDSDYQTQGDVFLAVQAIQQFCEVYEVGGSSDSSILTLMCRDSTIPYDDGTSFQNDGATITVLETALTTAGFTDVLVRVGRITDDDTDG
jgi:hypothetical protein